MKSIRKVFLVIATLVLILMVWQLFFNDGGVIKTGYNAVISPINKLWAGVTGDPNNKILPSWGDAVDHDSGGVDW